MAYRVLTKDGENFIKEICKKGDDDLLSGKNKYLFPFTIPPLNVVWTCKIMNDNITDENDIIESGGELATTLINWFNKYSKLLLVMT